MSDHASSRGHALDPLDRVWRPSVVFAALCIVGTLAAVPLLPFASAAGYVIVLTSGAALAATAFAFGAMASARHTRIRGTGWVAIAVAMLAGAVFVLVAVFVTGWSRLLFALWAVASWTYAAIVTNVLVRSRKTDAAEKIEKRDLGIFISYRRDDAIETVGRIYDHLKQGFDERRLFLDVDRQEGGVDLRESIRAALNQSDVVLAVIGPRWLSVSNPEGQRRLDDPGDWVRIEIESALASEVRLIPVLVQGARMPREEEMPAALRELAYRTAISVRPDPDFRRDIAQLVSDLSRREKRARIVP
jgi:TIR domain